MGEFRSPVDQAIAQRLINRDDSARSIEPYGPRGCEVRFRREIQTQSNAELTLLPVGVLLQLGAAQVGGQINIRRLDRFSRDGTDRSRNLAMEEACNTFIVGTVTPRALLVAECSASPTDGVPVVAAQRGKIERVNQVSERCESFFPKFVNTFPDDLMPFGKTAFGLSLFH